MLKIFYLRISDYPDIPDTFFYPYVGEDTRIAVQTYQNEQVRRSKLMGETMIRLKLQELWGLQQKDYRLLKGVHGKPYAGGTSCPVFFNLSHSGDYIVAAFAGSEVGVDIEKRKEQRMNVARRFFHPQEVRQLEICPENKREDLFYSYWSVKESFLKYTGSGLTAPLSGFEVHFTPEEIFITREGRRENVCIKECPVDSGYKCFVCSENEERPDIRPFRLVLS